MRILQKRAIFLSVLKDGVPKAEEVRRKLLLSKNSRMISTAIDTVLYTQDTQILQFVYSSGFEYVPWGQSLRNLFKRFSFAFGPSIARPSLRQAVLAWGAAFTPLSDQSGYPLMVVEYSSRTFKAIRTKTVDTIDEADLFATFLLTLLSCVYVDVSTFKTHLHGFVAVAKEIRRRTGNDESHLHLSTFSPLARDMILEGFRQFRPQLELKPLVIKFCQQCHQVIGPQSLIRRADYLMEFFGFDPNREYAFRRLYGLIQDSYGFASGRRYTDN